MAKYQDNPLEHAQALMDEADKLYLVHKGDIEKAKDHFLLKSDHLTARAAIDGRSGHYFPEIHPAIVSRAASIYNVMTTGEPPIKLSANNPDIPGLEESIDRLESYINKSFRAGGFWTSLYDAFVNAEMYPYASVYLGWEDKWGIKPFFDETTGKIEYRDWIVYSGVTLDALQPEDYRGDLFARSPGAMRYHFMMKDVSEGYIRQLGKQGLLNKYDPSKFQDGLSSGGEWAKKRMTERFNEDYLKPDDYKYEMITGWTKQYDEEKGVETWRVITFAGDMLLDEKESPYRGLGAPFGIFRSQPLPGEVAGMSTAMKGEANQNAINEFWNMRIEANEQDIWSPIVFKGEVSSNAIWEPQALWNVSDDFEHSPLIKPNTSNKLVDDIRMLEERNQQVLSAYDTIQPVQSKSKQTLGEYRGKRQEHSKILGVTYEFYAEVISDLTKMALAMARERLPDWIEIGMFGDDQILSSIEIADLAADVIVDIPKIRSLANEELEMIKWSELYPVLTENPLVNMNVKNLYSVTERYLEAMNEKKIDELIGTKPQTVPGGIPQVLGGQNAA